ncbi:MAG: S1 RNA-binding domain-containing protein [Myxococcota bacterium]|nr:S1 RNA-binding domain-containing protein [Myxococcota bacterium]
MRLSTYVQRTRALGDFSASATEIDAIGDMIAQGTRDFSDVLALRSDALVPIVLLGLWRAGHRHARHQNYLEVVAKRRRTEGDEQIPWALLKQTLARHEVAAMERAEEIAPLARTAEHRRRDAIKAAVTLWNACLAIVRKEASVVIRVETDRSHLVSEFGQFAGTTVLKDVPPHRWLGIRRGERLGALSVAIQLPLDRMIDQVKARSAELSAIGGGRDVESLLEALVLCEIEQWALTLKDEEVEFLTIKSASTTYLNMLTAAPANQGVVAAINIPPVGPVGVVVMLSDGRVIAHGSVSESARTVADIERLLGAHPVEAVILPIDSRRSDLLRDISAALNALPTIRASTKGMKASISTIQNDVVTAVKGAIVLGERILVPQAHWLKVDPVALGLAEYQQELNIDALRQSFADMQVLARAGICAADLQPKAVAPARPKARTNQQVLNPLVKGVDDLRPGMELDAMVTNITQFGAFLNVGLSHEGLVHVSELADHFVSDPNDIVTVGQQVKAHVLGVDRARRRISLSLRTDRRNQPRQEPQQKHLDRIDGPSKRSGVPLDDIPGRGGRPSGRPSVDRGRPMGTVSRAQALADLEALFKKK